MGSRAVVLTVLLAACAQSGSPGSVLEETAANLPEIRSGEIDMEVSTRARDEGAEVGFRISGPFSFEESKRLPAARLEYSSVGGPEETSATFISNGSQAFIDQGSGPMPIPPHQVPRFAAEGAPVIGDLPLAAWVKDPALEPGPSLEGVETHRITGSLDVAAALADLARIAASVDPATAARIPDLGETERDHLQQAVRSATIEVITERERRYLRSLSWEVRFGASGPEPVRPALEQLTGLELTFGLRIDRPNAEVRLGSPPG